jgi:hypothetical protein
MFFGLFKGRSKEQKDLVFDEFKSQLEKQGIKIDSVDDTGLIHITMGDTTLNVSLDNLRKNYSRDKDSSHISNFVQTLVSYSIEIPSRWINAKDDIYVSFFPNDFQFNDFLHHKITDRFSKVYVHNGQDKLTWITKNDLLKWNITEADIAKQANINADKLLSGTPISIENIENHKLGLIESESTSLKGALLFAPAMKEKVIKDFSFPFYAVLPVRDFCYIFSEEDFDFFSSKIGAVVVDEYKQSGYPITTEILKFTDNGVEVVGEYSIE